MRTRCSTIRRFSISGLAAAALILASAASPYGNAFAVEGTLVSACRGTIGCPNKINLRGPVDTLQFYALLTPASAISPTTEPISVTVSNSSGVVFSETLGGGNLLQQGRRFQFRDPSARRTGGFSRITLVQKGTSYRLAVIAHGDMSAATVADMTVSIAIGDDTFSTQNTWSKREFGWLLHLPAAPAPPTPTGGPTATPTPAPPTPTAATPTPSPTDIPLTPTPSAVPPTPTPAPPTPTPTPEPTPTEGPYGSVFEAFVQPPASLLR